MLERPGAGDIDDAEAFANCYKRLGIDIPKLLSEGCNSRIMLDYSANLPWGFKQMGRYEILDSLKNLACDPTFHRHVGWLGTLWRHHALATSNPIPDLRPQILAWQHNFEAIFGVEAL